MFCRIGLLLISQKFTEEKLLGIAYAIEQILKPVLDGRDVLYVEVASEIW